MLLHSIRLKNIRSFGSGADGRGQTLAFARGINRLSGRNGHGKSTVVEALGYALFGVEPEHSERFLCETYFLRRGAAEGEIEVDFSTEERRYGLFCPVGKNSRRRMRVWSLTDDVEEAENTGEVRAFLARLFRARHPEALADQFSKLIGMRQGRMTWPFDAKPTEVKNHFEPLLEVAIYDDCNRQLAPVSSRLRQLLNEQRNEKTRCLTQWEALADAAELLALAQARAATLGTRLDGAKTRHHAAQAALTVAETQARQAREAEQHVAATRHALVLAESQAREAGQRRDEAAAAVAVAEETRERFVLWQEADATLRDVQAQMEERQALERARFAAQELFLQAGEKARTSRAKEADFAEKASQTRREAEQKEHDRAGQSTRWQAGLAPAEALAREAAQARAGHHSWRQWLQSAWATQEQLAHDRREIEGRKLELSAWNGQGLAEARSKLLAAATAREEQAAELTRLRTQRQQLAEQLGQIEGGLCPFLKESCRQFDPAKIRQDLALLQAEEEERLRAAPEREARFAQDRQQAQGLEREATQVEERRRILEKDAAMFQAKLTRHVENLADRSAGLLPGAFLNPGVGQDARAPVLEAAPAFLSSLDEQCGLAEISLRAMEEESARLAESRLIQQERISALSLEQKRLAKLGEEFAQKCADWQAQADFAESEATAREIEQAFLAQQAEAFPHLEAERQLAERQRARNKAAHDSHLAALPRAKTWTALEEQSLAANARKTAGEKAWQLALAEAVILSAGFSTESLATCQAAEREAYALVAALHVQAHTAQAEVQRQQARSAEAQRTRRTLEEVSRGEERLVKALDLTESMRKILPKAAPRIAQTLCNRVAAQAQKLYNRLSPAEPAQLQWIAFTEERAQYSLRLEPAGRRFAMLSGGEQTKLALAMVLAMIQELTTLRFCIFDEPTYGIDSDSRNLIADAILEAQEYCQLEQIILVSHDDAFAGRVEHEIQLVKTAREGSMVG